jgi:hypothetical protein
MGVGESQVFTFMTACGPSLRPDAHVRGLPIVRRPRKLNAELTGQTFASKLTPK